jgi:hypothetical protein
MDDNNNSSASLRGIGTMMMVLAALSVLAGVIVGIVLISHKTCSGQFCIDKHSDLVGAGLAVLVTGIVQGALFVAIGYIAHGVAEIHEQLQPGPRRAEQPAGHSAP